MTIGTDEVPRNGTDEVPRIGTDEVPRIGTDEVPRIGTEFQGSGIWDREISFIVQRNKQGFKRMLAKIIVLDHNLTNDLWVFRVR